MFVPILAICRHSRCRRRWVEEWGQKDDRTTFLRTGVFRKRDIRIGQALHHVGELDADPLNLFVILNFRVPILHRTYRDCGNKKQEAAKPRYDRLKRSAALDQVNEKSVLDGFTGHRQQMHRFDGESNDVGVQRDYCLQGNEFILHNKPQQLRKRSKKVLINLGKWKEFDCGLEASNKLVQNMTKPTFWFHNYSQV